MSRLNPIWDKHFYQTSPIFSPLAQITKQLTANNNWPDLDAYNQLITKNEKQIVNHNGLHIRFIPQTVQQISFDDQYESMIYQQGLVQTRMASWHDFFQVLIWSIFPITKSYLNALHYQSSLERRQKNPNNKLRSKLENFVTLFDECGAVIIYNDPLHKSLIQNFDWRELFINNKKAFTNNLECIVFGHAMYEKSIMPYIGMTAHVLFLYQPDSFFSLPMTVKLAIIDKSLAQLLKENKDWTTKDLNPFPLLGVPGWYPDNNRLEFYNNDKYFRKKPV